MKDYDIDQLEAARSRIERADLLPDDRELIEQFDDGLDDRQETGVRSQTKHLQRIRTFAEHRVDSEMLDEIDEDERDQFHTVALADTLVDADAAEAYDDWLDRRRWRGSLLAEKTKVHYRTTIRVFGTVLTDHQRLGDQVPPPSMDNIYGGDPRPKEDRDKTPNPGEVSWWDPHVITAIDEGCYNVRDQALVAVAWDSGARPEELHDLTMRHLEYDGEFYRITVGSKDHPSRDPLIPVATPYLRKWLTVEHPANFTDSGFSPDTPIWAKLQHADGDVEGLRPRSFDSIFEDIRNRIDHTRPLNCAWMRRSRASILAMRDNMNQTKLEDRLGWVRGSQVAGAYIARFNKNTDADVAEGDGIPPKYLDRGTQDHRKDAAPFRCPNCEQWSPRHYENCFWCGEGIVPGEAEEADPGPILRETKEYREKRDRFVRQFAEDPTPPDPEKLQLAQEFGEVTDPDAGPVKDDDLVDDLLEIFDKHGIAGI